MTESVETLERRLESLDGFRDIVIAMRGLAATRLQRAQGALPGARNFETTIASGLSQVMAMGRGAAPPRRPRREGLVLLAPEHGFVGALARRLITHARSVASNGPVLLVGRRGALMAEESAFAVTDWMALASSAADAPRVGARLADRLRPLLREGSMDGLRLIYPRHADAGSADIHDRPLLPVDPATLPAAPGPPPLTGLPPADMLEPLIGQFLLARLVTAALETIASENAARLAVMEASRRNVEDKIADVTHRWHSARQEAITTEIADVTAGVLAAERRNRRDQ